MDPIKGCRAVSGAEANSATAEKYTDFITQCQARVFGTDLIHLNNVYELSLIQSVHYPFFPHFLSPLTNLQAGVQE